MRKALVVGIDDYGTSPLNGCINDAEAVADILSKNEDGSPNFEVRLEKNVGTKGQLKRMISNFCSLCIRCKRCSDDLREGRIYGRVLQARL